MGLSLSNLLLLVGVNTAVVGLLLTWYAFGSKIRITDVSSERSLHQGKALTGAGVFMFLPLCLSIVVVFPDFLPAYLILVMSLLGFADDKFDLSFKLRLIGQIILMLVCLKYYGFNHYGLMIFLLLAGIWWINLFNFMDGANGMAGFHGLVTLSFYAMVFYQHQSLNFIIYSALAILIVYLVFNVILKKLFMGDSGSLPLAFLLVVMAFWSIQSGWVNYLQVALIHAVFITDATITLLVRLYHKENITHAHASHLYQRLVKSGSSHLTVSLSYALLTALFCGGALWFDKLQQTAQISWLLLTYSVLLVIFMKTFKLGR